MFHASVTFTNFTSMFHYHWAVSCMIRKVSAEDIAIRGNGTGPEYMCPTRHFVYIFFNPVFQVSTAKNEINLFNNHVLIVAPVTFAPAGAMTPSAEFLLDTNFRLSMVRCLNTKGKYSKVTNTEIESSIISKSVMIIIFVEFIDQLINYQINCASLRINRSKTSAP